MTWVKICGTTNLEDALAAVDAGANAVGFVFYRRSRRAVDLATVRAIVEKLPDAMGRIGVFVNESVEKVVDIVHQAGLTAVQLHGEEDVEYSRALYRKLGNGGPRPMIFRSLAARVFDVPDDECVGWDPVQAGILELDENYHGQRVRKLHVAEDGDLFLETHGFRPGVIGGILLDSSTPTQRGGTGRTFDWERVRPWVGVMNSISKLVVAGGLTSRNVGDAMAMLHPWGVDVVSGVESRPGKKDWEKLRAFVQAVRRAEKSS
jgi:phosphoribosylanthranilate isomerase